MAVLRDTFWDDAQARLTSTGWVILNGSRYDPTVLDGLTPTGRVFQFTMTRDGLVTITVAGRTRTRQVAAGDHEDGAGVVTKLLATWEQLPASQQ